MTCKVVPISARGRCLVRPHDKCCPIKKRKSVGDVYQTVGECFVYVELKLEGDLAQVPVTVPSKYCYHNVAEPDAKLVFEPCGAIEVDVNEARKRARHAVDFGVEI